MPAPVSHEVIPLNPGRFRLQTQDPAFRVEWRGGNRFRLSGEVASRPATTLHVGLPTDELSVSLPEHTRPLPAALRLKDALPRDVHLVATADDGDVDLRLLELVVPAATPPCLRVLLQDAGLRVEQLADNRVRFSGVSKAPAIVTILCDSRRASLALPRASTAAACAARVGLAVPQGFRALVEGPVVSVWKDADFFGAIAQAS